MGAGILPVSYHNGSFYFLFSRECRKQDWRDFGGATEKNETIKQTAIREAFEESDGILGTRDDVKKLLEKETFYKVKTKTYFVYVVNIPYDKTLPRKFKKRFDKIAKSNPEKIATNGLYEKDKLMWIRLENIPKHMDKFKPWYKKIVNKILVAFNNFNKN
jgi:8-oxo-dGTP pyrophosphatase MutT (NUDIX family)